MSIGRLHLSVLALLLALGARAAALTIVIDYSYDTTNVFAGREDVRAVLDKAAHDLGSLLATSPGAVTTNSFTGTSGGTSVTFKWSLSFANPATGAQVTQTTFTADPDTVVMHVGFRPLSGGLLDTSNFVQASEIVMTQGSSNIATAGAAAAAASNAVMPRDTPTMGSLAANFGGSAYTLRYGAFGGSISFEDDVDGNGSADPGQLDQYWSFSLAGPVANRRDFYSVALRGMVEALGFGHSEAWLAQADGTTWNGARASAFFGGGANLITTDGRIASGLMGASLFDGTQQEAAMASDLALGTRRYLTTADVAFLQDYGFQVVPEPAAGLLLILGGAALASSRRAGRFRLVSWVDCR